MKNRTVDIRHLSATTGAEIRGVDISKPLEEQAYREIRDALCEWGVIFFRGQNLDTGQHIAFAKRFGPIVISTANNKLPDHPEISDIRKEPTDKYNVGGKWHSDHSFSSAPPLGSVLVARVLPKVGGDTLFASMYGAYDRLSDGLKKTLATMKAVHQNPLAYAESGGAAPQIPSGHPALLFTKAGEAIHDVTPIHPETGRRLLFVNSNYTRRFDGWTEAESRPLLNYLFEQSVKPENTVRFHWEEGSVAFWDNRCVCHLALNDYHGALRSMHRITVGGPVFAH